MLPRGEEKGEDEKKREDRKFVDQWTSGDCACVR
jgi:hypothetical protein